MGRWVGHAVIGEGPVSLVHRINDSVHLLAGGIWLGGLVPLAASAVRATRSRGGVWLAVLRDALPRFSVAVVLVAITELRTGPSWCIDGLTGTPYWRLLLLKIALFLLMVSVVLINHFILSLWIDREVMPIAGTTALAWTLG